MLKYIILICFVVCLPLFAAGATTHPAPLPRPANEVVVPVPAAVVPVKEPEPAGESLTVTLNDIDKSLTEVQNNLKSKDWPDQDLVTFQKELDTFPDQLSVVITKATSYAANVKMRLDQLGVKTNLPEDPKVTAERDDLQKRSMNLDGVLKRANLFTVEVTQMQAVIAAHRKEIFAHSSWWKGYVWDVPDDLYAAFFGFKIGDVVISPFKISIAALLFVLIYAGSRLFLRWANKRIFNRFDYGTRDSIHTTLGWLGFIIAFCVAINYLGVNFEKLTIIVGALSVGIGFGLQGIVGNFISGLIILWERTIRIGDLIVVGLDRGVISKISIRATTIDTVDCSQVIIPNSMLISGVVTNFVRNDRIGRLVMTLTVSVLSDCQGIEALVKEHPLILKDPPPTVEVVAIAPAIQIEVSAFVADIGTIPKVKSDLYFIIAKNIKEHLPEEVHKDDPPPLKAPNNPHPLTGGKKKKSSIVFRDVDLKD
jgi:small-conductance mechanosensitive channel